MKTEVKKARSKVPINRGKFFAKQGWAKVGYAALLMLWTLVSVVASQLLVGRLMILILQDNINSPVWSGAYSLISYGLALVLILFVPPRFKASITKENLKTGEKKKLEYKNKAKISTTREEIGLLDTPTWTDIGLSPVAYLVSSLLAGGLVALFSLFPWFNANEAQVTGFSPYMNNLEMAIAFIVLVILAPVVEEVIFRGWLYGKLRSKLNVVWSILLTSFLFALVHFQWNVSINVFALSVVLCVLREITGTIYSGILTHMVKNGIAFYLLYVLGM